MLHQKEILTQSSASLWPKVVSRSTVVRPQIRFLPQPFDFPTGQPCVCHVLFLVSCLLRILFMPTSHLFIYWGGALETVVSLGSKFSKSPKVTFWSLEHPTEWTNEIYTNQASGTGRFAKSYFCTEQLAKKNKQMYKYMNEHANCQRGDRLKSLWQSEPDVTEPSFNTCHFH